MPLQQKVQKPDFVLDIPFGNILVLNNGGAVTSVNGKKGDVLLNAIDVGADSVGAAKMYLMSCFQKLNLLNILQKLISLISLKKLI